MIFLIIGAPFIFAIGLFTAILFLILFLSFTNGIPLTDPMHICISMYIQCSLFWFKLTRKSFRINAKTIQNSIDILKLKSISYIRVLPMTTLSKEAQFWDSLLFQEKQKTFISELKKPYNPSRIQLLRIHMQFSEPMFTLNKDKLCTIKIEKIDKIPVHWISYKGSNISNGLILAIHGGGYVAGMPSMQYSVCSEISKLTGCVCVSVDYRLCPGTPNNPITITHSLNDCFTVYKHLILNKHIQSNKICITGESAGGGLSLLLIQKIRDYNVMHSNVSIGNPKCCWVNSPWTNLKMDSGSVSKNCDIDAMLAYDPNKYFQRMAIGEIDINLKKMNQNVSLTDKRFSPLFGEWKDLCPIYFVVGAAEMLLDDTLEAAKKAKDEGVDVQVDIEPFMHHTFPLFLRTLPEAKHSVVRASDFIIKHLKIC